jgi:hypothetical protein
MRSPWLLLAPLTASLFLISSSNAAILPPCCVIPPPEPDDHADRHPEEAPRERVPATVTNRDAERLLEIAVELPVPAKAPLVNAIGIPLDAPRGVSEPEHVVPVELSTSPVDPNAVLELDSDDHGPPCCQIAGEPHEPDPDEIRTPDLIGADVTPPDERALEAATELPVPAKVPLVNAIGIPFDAPRGISDPEFRPVIARGQPEIDYSPCCSRQPNERAPVDAPWRWLRTLEAYAEVVVPIFLFLMAIGFWIVWRRRRPAQLESQPPSPRWFPVRPLRPEIAPLPVPEPEVAQARARREGRELEPV